MKELIELTPQEDYLQDRGTRVTLNDVAKGDLGVSPKTKTGSIISHKNLLQKFNTMVEALNESECSQLNFQPAKFRDTQGKARPTIEMDLKTLVWFASSYHHSLRLSIVTYAFDKMKRESDTRLAEAVKEAKQLQKLITGECSIRRCITEAWNEMEEAPNESEVWQAMTWKNLAEATYVTKLIRVIPDGLNHIVGVMKHPGNVKYNPQLVRDTWEDYVEAGKPSPTERERLTTEYNIVLENYKKKFEELEQVRD